MAFQRVFQVLDHLGALSPLNKRTKSRIKTNILPHRALQRAAGRELPGAIHQTGGFRWSQSSKSAVSSPWVPKMRVMRVILLAKAVRGHVHFQTVAELQTHCLHIGHVVIAFVHAGP